MACKSIVGPAERCGLVSYEDGLSVSIVAFLRDKDKDAMASKSIAALMTF